LVIGDTAGDLELSDEEQEESGKEQAVFPCLEALSAWLEKNS
jgi:hypothetical protein